MAIRVNLNYVVRQTGDGIQFTTPTLVGTANKRNYLNATGLDPVVPMVFTSSNPAVASVTLENSYWHLDYIGSGTTTITATQGVKTISKTITVNSENNGRIINVGSGSGDLTISSASLNLLPGDTVIISPGTYNSITITDIIVPDGQPKITITCYGLVEVVGDFNVWTFSNLRNVYIDGSRVSGIKHGMVSRDNIYIGAFCNGPMNYVTISNFKQVNIFNNGFHWDNNDLVYDGTADSYYKGCKFINFYIDNAGDFSTGGSINTNNTDKIKGLCVDFSFIGWEIYNSSPGGNIRISCGQDILFKDLIIDSVNTVNNNHNGILFVQGHADVINCSVKNVEGNLIRLWYFSIVDGILGTEPKKAKFFGNVSFTSRKYSLLEYQGFDNFYLSGLTTYLNLDIFHNTVGNLNQNLPRVFTGTLVDNYGLRGGTARVFNNILINPVNPDGNNIFFTFGVSAPNGSETQVGFEQEWNNRVYSTYQIGKVNPANLALQSGCTAIGSAISNEMTVYYNTDLYGNSRSALNIGAIQGMDIIMPTSIPVPTTPDVSQQLELIGTTNPTASDFMIEAKKSFSQLGIKNYDIDINGSIITTKGGYARTGKQDPSEINPDFLPVTGGTYKFRFRGRDWNDQVSAWSNYNTYRMASSVIETTSGLTLTKTSGGVLNFNSGLYSASGSTVFASTSISINTGNAARVIFDYPNPLVSTGILGFGTGSTILTQTDVKAGMWTIRNTDGSFTPSRIGAIADGIQVDNSKDWNASILCSVYVNYDGRIWREDSYDNGMTWNKIGASRYIQYQLSSTYIGTLYVIAMIPVGAVIQNPRYKIYPGV